MARKRKAPSSPANGKSTAAAASTSEENNDNMGQNPDTSTTKRLSKEEKKLRAEKAKAKAKAWAEARKAKKSGKAAPSKTTASATKATSKVRAKKPVKEETATKKPASVRKTTQTKSKGKTTSRVKKQVKKEPSKTEKMIDDISKDMEEREDEEKENGKNDGVTASEQQKEEVKNVASRSDSSTESEPDARPKRKRVRVSSEDNRPAAVVKTFLPTSLESQKPLQSGMSSTTAPVPAPVPAPVTVPVTVAVPAPATGTTTNGTNVTSSNIPIAPRPPEQTQQQQQQQQQQAQQQLYAQMMMNSPTPAAGGQGMNLPIPSFQNPYGYSPFPQYTANPPVAAAVFQQQQHPIQQQANMGYNPIYMPNGNSSVTSPPMQQPPPPVTQQQQPPPTSSQQTPVISVKEIPKPEPSIPQPSPIPSPKAEHNGNDNGLHLATSKIEKQEDEVKIEPTNVTKQKSQQIEEEHADDISTTSSTAAVDDSSKRKSGWTRRYVKFALYLLLLSFCSFMLIRVIMNLFVASAEDGGGISLDVKKQGGEAPILEHVDVPCFLDQGNLIVEEDETKEDVCSDQKRRIPCPEHGRCANGKLVDCLFSESTDMSSQDNTEECATDTEGMSCKASFSPMFVPSKNYDKCVLSDSALEASTNLKETLVDLTVEQICGGVFSHSSVSKESILEVDADSSLPVDAPNSAYFFSLELFPTLIGLGGDELLKLVHEMDVSSIVEMSANGTNWIGLSTDFVEKSLPLPTQCWAQIFFIDTMKYLCVLLFQMAQRGIILLWKVINSNPLPTAITLIVLQLYRWVQKRRHRIISLKAKTAKVRQLAYDKLVLDCSEGEGYAVLHLRDEIALELYPELCADRKHLMEVVWPRVVKEVRVDNRVRKVRKSVGGKSLDWWEWVSDASRNSRRNEIEAALQRRELAG